MTALPYAVIGAGPSGLAAARNLQRFDVPWVGYELGGDVGGLWDIEAPRSTVYESAHLISSRTTTEFTEFPMDPSVADYPSHRDLKRYFDDFATRFGLRDGYTFGAEVTSAEPAGDGTWEVTANGVTRRHTGVIVANGTLSEPNIPTFAGHFDGELLHSSEYTSATVFAGKRVLVVRHPSVPGGLRRRGVGRGHGRCQVVSSPETRWRGPVSLRPDSPRWWSPAS